MKDFALSVLIVSILVLFFAKYDPAVKDAVFSVLGVAFAAYCVWLTVRIVNSREKRAIRTAVVLVLVFVAYPLSMGPMVWLGEHGYLPKAMQPVFDQALSLVIATMRFGPPTIGRWMSWYIGLWHR